MAAAYPSTTLAAALRQFLAEGALVELGDHRALQLVALVEEGQPERHADIAEDLGVLGPGDDRARAHHGRQVAVDEGRTRHVGDAHHLVDDVAALGVAVMLGLGQHDVHFVVVRQVVQRGDDRPAVHLRLVDLLRAVIEAGGVAEADRVGGGEQAEGRMRADDAALVEQRQAARRFQHALDDEHHVRAAGVVLVEAQRDIVLVGPGQDAVAEFGDLHAVLDDDGVLADEVDAADMAVEVDAHARPVEARRDLLDMGRLAGAVIARHHDAAVVGEAGEDRRAWSAGRTDSPDRGPAHVRSPPNRPAPPSWTRSRIFPSPTPSCPAGWRCRDRPCSYLSTSPRAKRRVSPAIQFCSGAVLKPFPTR